MAKEESFEEDELKGDFYKALLDESNSSKESKVEKKESPKKEKKQPKPKKGEKTKKEKKKSSASKPKSEKPKKEKKKSGNPKPKSKKINAKKNTSSKANSKKASPGKSASKKPSKKSAAKKNILKNKSSQKNDSSNKEALTSKIEEIAKKRKKIYAKKICEELGITKEEFEKEAMKLSDEYTLIKRSGKPYMVIYKESKDPKELLDMLEIQLSLFKDLKIIGLEKILKKSIKYLSKKKSLKSHDYAKKAINDFASKSKNQLNAIKKCNEYSSIINEAEKSINGINESIKKYQKLIEQKSKELKKAKEASDKKSGLFCIKKEKLIDSAQKIYDAIILKTPKKARGKNPDKKKKGNWLGLKKLMPDSNPEDEELQKKGDENDSMLFDLPNIEDKMNNALESKEEAFVKPFWLEEKVEPSGINIVQNRDFGDFNQDFELKKMPNNEEKGMPENQKLQNEQELMGGEKQDSNGFFKDGPIESFKNESKEDETMIEESKNADEEKKDLMKNTALSNLKNFSTEVDQLLELVKEEGMVSFKKLARLYEETTSTIEVWCQALEENGLVTIHYPIFGSPYIKYKKD